MVLSREQVKTLRQAGYKIRTYERVLERGQVSTDGLRPDEPGGDYDSFPAVFSPAGRVIQPYDRPGKQRPIAAQWESAWQHYNKANHPFNIRAYRKG